MPKAEAKTNWAELSIRFPGGEKRVVALQEDRYELGRGNSNALCFPEVQGLSRRHTAFEHEESGWFVSDLGSTNGTFVNGTRIFAPTVLRANDCVTVGALRIVFSDQAPPPRARHSGTVVFVQEPASMDASAIEATLSGAWSADQEQIGRAHV